MARMPSSTKQEVNEKMPIELGRSAHRGRDLHLHMYYINVMANGKNNMNGKRNILNSEREICTADGMDARVGNRGIVPALH
eukprot:12093694-Heterocapsa_arctica.AAC.1